jgi:hypothetical protein
MSAAQTQQRQVTGTTGTTATTATSTTAAAASGVDTADVATLNDALGSAGVDLRVLFPPSVLFSLFNDAHLGRRREFAAVIRLTPSIPPFRGSVEEATHNAFL